MACRTLLPVGLIFAAVVTVAAIGCSKGDSAGVPASIEASGEGAQTTGEGAPKVTTTVNVGDSPFAASERAASAAAARDMHPSVVFKTSLGDVTVKLDGEKAPLTVDNFLNNYVRHGYYTNTIFHYVAPGTMIVGGGYDAENNLKPTRPEIQNEADNGLSNKRGTLAMARAADFAHSANSQFFFNLSDNTQFDHQDRESADTFGYCVFGEVTKGMDVLEKISGTTTREAEISPQLPVQPVIIQSVELIP